MKRKSNDFAAAKKVNKKEKIIYFWSEPQKPDVIWFSADTARWLAEKFLKSAERLERLERSDKQVHKKRRVKV